MSEPLTKDVVAQIEQKITRRKELAGDLVHAQRAVEMLETNEGRCTVYVNRESGDRVTYFTITRAHTLGLTKQYVAQLEKELAEIDSVLDVTHRLLNAPKAEAKQ